MGEHAGIARAEAKLTIAQSYIITHELEPVAAPRRPIDPKERKILMCLILTQQS